jgi:NAD(P)-dependent dehydrogenase (short-subunit alcohol dehydrogenase family)
MGENFRSKIGAGVGMIGDEIYYSTSLMRGKRILVTGASSGIGRAVAVSLSNVGASVVLTGRDEDKLSSTAAKLGGGGHSVYPFDLSRGDEIPGFLKKIALDQGSLDGIFHAAGTASVRAITSVNPSLVDKIFSSSIKGALLLSRGFCREGVFNQRANCSLVFMSSVAAARGQTGLSVYSASKGAVDSMVRSLAVEFAERRIRVNSLTAGAVRSEMHDKLVENLPSESLQAYEARHLLGFGSVEDVSRAALFLLSDLSGWVTGTNLVVDGGYTCR